jgi:hypothetical protein
MLLVNIQLDELQKFEQINVPAHPTLYICMHGLFLASKAINISTFLIEGDIYIYIYIYIEAILLGLKTLNTTRKLDTNPTRN